MHCLLCSGFVTPNISTCTCDKTPALDTRIDQHFLLIEHLFTITKHQSAMLDTQRATIETLSQRLDQFQEAEDRQDAELTAIRSEVVEYGSWR